MHRAWVQSSTANERVGEEKEKAERREKSFAALSSYREH